MQLHVQLDIYGTVKMGMHASPVHLRVLKGGAAPVPAEEKLQIRAQVKHICILTGYLAVYLEFHFRKKNIFCSMVTALAKIFS